METPKRRGYVIVQIDKPDSRVAVAFMGVDGEWKTDYDEDTVVHFDRCYDATSQTLDWSGSKGTHFAVWNTSVLNRYNAMLMYPQNDRSIDL